LEINHFNYSESKENDNENNNNNNNGHALFMDKNVEELVILLFAFTGTVKYSLDRFLSILIVLERIQEEKNNSLKSLSIPSNIKGKNCSKLIINL